MKEGFTSIGAATGDLFASIEKDRAKKSTRELTLIDKGFEIAASRPEGVDVNVSADWHVLSAVSGTPERPGLVDCGHDVLCS